MKTGLKPEYLHSRSQKQRFIQSAPITKSSGFLRFSVRDSPSSSSSAQPQTSLIKADTEKVDLFHDCLNGELEKYGFQDLRLREKQHEVLSTWAEVMS